MRDLSDWVGRTQERTDRLDPSALARLAAMLDLERAAFLDGPAPPLSHWLAFLPDERQSEIGSDGHPRRGSFLPPVLLPRRMWAGGRLDFVGEIRTGQSLDRKSTIVSVTSKQGVSGPLQFVTIRHEVSVAGNVVLVEEQDLVFRGQSGAASSGNAAPPAAMTRRITPEPALLFRFSALTFNAHRIHYDRNYAVDEEGYPGLVVHGPLQAMLLMHMALETVPASRVAHFSFRSVRALTDNTPFDLCLDPAEDKIAMATRTPAGNDAMRAQLLLR